MKKKLSFIIALTIIVLNITMPSSSQNSNGLQLVSSKSTSDNYYRYITGVVKNTGSETYNTVAITFNLYDSSGSLVGNTIDSIQNFRPGMTWKFKAMIADESAVKFEIQSLEGY